jgi:hypothetical protein
MTALVDGHQLGMYQTVGISLYVLFSSVRKKKSDKKKKKKVETLQRFGEEKQSR